ncbi:SusD/RagB family nutrient-binding outer membrane lipoprotein [Pedobacter duraquae]|uniref:SusD-like starch-binding protein associating with outer membrane n=1 Tax=Pedobacter duraquae TaxID=425511 RepID=A0A4R6IQW1_9SPHI|nr:SusD/RagB family nutrient-binding outer membrane lipoprotein [Pedobacter duraquae]TDO24591.1 SusD-like starch-binding protein associating with outer membrane [Pedobacter duraquae]
MKTKVIIIISAVFFTFASGCKKGFDTLNVDPNNPTSLDPAFLFTNAEFSTYSPTMETEPTVVQQFVNPFTGVTAAFNFNQVNQTYTAQTWNAEYTGTNTGATSSAGPVKLLVQILAQLKGNTARTNLYNQSRIWKAYQFMLLVDTYGNVPYSEAGQAYLNNIQTPKYDNQQAIYTDLINEVTSATAALDASKDIVTADLFYAGNIAQWKKLGYSLLLRLGMRYSKFDVAKAQTIVQAAFAGGVMTSNADNCYVKYTTNYVNPVSQAISVISNTYYLAAPFVNQLKNSGDPRLKFIAGKYANPATAPTTVPDTTSANQFGMPIGYNSATLSTAPGFRGANGSGFNYSQINYSIFGSLTAPQFFVTYAQTQLLLAEAAFRGWLPTGSTPDVYYANGIRGAMDQWTTYNAAAVIPLATQNAFINNPVNAYNTANALNLINTQYWVASWGNGAEAWANFRRSGFPALTPNPIAGQSITGGFVRRYVYPTLELSANLSNYKAAVADIGGTDNMDTRIFWDK